MSLTIYGHVWIRSIIWLYHMIMKNCFIFSYCNPSDTWNEKLWWNLTKSVDYSLEVVVIFGFICFGLRFNNKLQSPKNFEGAINLINSQIQSQSQQDKFLFFNQMNKKIHKQISFNPHQHFSTARPNVTIWSLNVLV